MPTGVATRQNQGANPELGGNRMSLRMNYNAASPEGIRALRRVDGYLLQSGLSKSLLELVYLRISQINGCAYCISKHSSDLLKGGMALEKVLLVGVWREADGF